MINLFIKIINNLARPHKIPKKILNKLNYYFSYKKYNQNFFEEEQNKIFEYFGLNRQEGIKKLISTKKDLDFKLRDSDMSSEHEVIFSSLSLSKNQSFSDILEINETLFSYLEDNIENVEKQNINEEIVENISVFIKEGKEKILKDVSKYSIEQNLIKYSELKDKSKVGFSTRMRFKFMHLVEYFKKKN